MTRSRIRSRGTRGAVLLMVGGLVLAACGSDNEQAGSTAAPTTVAATAAPTSEADAPTTDAPVEGTTAPVEGTTAPVEGTEAPSEDTTPSGGELPAISVSSANFPESQLLAEIYAQALERAGVEVTRVDSIGAREAYYAAIDNNEISLVPEYTNSLLSFVSNRSGAAMPESPTIDEQVTALKDALPDGLTVGAASTAEDKDVIVCNADVASENSLTTLSDLAAVADQIKLGAPPEFETRTPFGLVGFKDILGAEFKKFVPLTIGAVADSIKSGAIDCGNLFSTMSVILTEGFLPLEDDKTLVAHEAVLPLLTKEAATPEVLTVLDKVSAGLSTDILKALMVKIEVDKLSVDVVAQQYLATLSTGS